MICLSALITFVTILTLSKAAILALFLCIMFAIKPFNYKYSKLVILILICSLLLFLSIGFLKISETVVYDRLINLPYESDSSLEVRGYFVYLKSNLTQSFFGMGPKNVFINHNGNEVHSTLAMILSSYGLIGLLIFASLTLFWILDIKQKYGMSGVICVCGPPLLYGLTHNGIRFSFFWILFAITICMSNEIIKKTRDI
jgi:hypothetical protein